MGLSHWSECSTGSLSGIVHPTFLSLTLAYGQFDSSTKQISNLIRRTRRVCCIIDLLIKESAYIPSKGNEPPSDPDPDISSNDIESPSDPNLNSGSSPSTLPRRRRWAVVRNANPTAGSSRSSQSEGAETLGQSPSVYHSGNENQDNDGFSSGDESDIELRPRSRKNLRTPGSETLKDTKIFPDLPEELDDQLLLFTLNTNLCMAGKEVGTEGDRHIIRHLISQPHRAIINSYFCTLEVTLLK
jgi:hypothetical protein